MKIHGDSSSPHCIPSGSWGRTSRRNNEFCKSSLQSPSSSRSVNAGGVGWGGGSTSLLQPPFRPAAGEQSCGWPCGITPGTPLLQQTEEKRQHLTLRPEELPPSHHTFGDTPTGGDSFRCCSNFPPAGALPAGTGAVSRPVCAAAGAGRLPRREAGAEWGSERAASPPSAMNTAKVQRLRARWSEIKMAAGPGQENNGNFYSHFHLFQYHSTQTQFDLMPRFCFKQRCVRQDRQQSRLQTDVSNFSGQC